MLRKFTQLSVAACLLLLATSAAIPSPQEGSEKRPKDQAEYELANKSFTAAQSGDWKTALEGLDEWKQKYPDSAYKEDWPRIYLRAYQNTGQKEKAIAIAKDILKASPNDFESNFLIASLVPTMGGTDAALMADGVKAANAVLANRPAQANEEQWKQIQITALQTLGWTAMQKKDHQEAEKEFMKVLQLNPNLAQVSYWLGNEVLAQGNPNKNELALFSFARAASYEGEGALNAQGRQQVDEYLKKVYTKYHGSEEGLDGIKATAKTQALPPAGLKIKSKDVIDFEKEADSRKKEPMLWAFKDLKASLLGSNGDGIWSDLQGKLAPKMQLYVVGSDSARPQVVTFSSTPDGPVEVVVNLENRLREAPGKGRKMVVDGVASSLTKDPFKLSLTSGSVN
ncbi:MAG: tetratricopeptide repeat protein [Acidobacteria bacterium]|nr:tetratricopeptide repeat protein [Acidobacteriota bacterium]